ncbi:cytochrome c oxidase assembly factor 4 homolog, mitochondrial [Calliphora vicina]|uniref:cytochrome c oxidase assembly factor 4 homolog, mitochondrial n=1 Tax=Calliphora vicina TaxID=7373 RepID=UPI00325BE8E3
MSESDQDPVEVMLKKTGCIELHYKVQECIAETGDWRSCQDKVKEFKDCMQKYVDAQTKKYAHLK